MAPSPRLNDGRGALPSPANLQFLSAPFLQNNQFFDLKGQTLTFGFPSGLGGGGLLAREGGDMDDPSPSCSFPSQRPGDSLSSLRTPLPLPHWPQGSPIPLDTLVVSLIWTQRGSQLKGLQGVTWGFGLSHCLSEERGPRLLPAAGEGCMGRSTWSGRTRECSRMGSCWSRGSMPHQASVEKVLTETWAGLGDVGQLMVLRDTRASLVSKGLGPHVFT